jgi:RNA polymerase sigma-70 factor, ECF subfamily
MRKVSEEAFHEIYNAFYEDVYRYVCQLAGKKTDAEDLVQEIFLQAYRSFAQFRGECGYKTWLFAIAHSQVNSMWRKLFRRRQIQEEYEQQVRVEANGLEEDEWRRRLLVEELQDVLTELPPSYRDVIVLRYLHDFSVRDTGIILRMTDNKVRVQTHRGLLKLREKWEGGDVHARAKSTPAT